MESRRKDYYEILGLDSAKRDSYSTEDIRRAYKKKSVKVHPDKNRGSKIAEDKFKLLNEAHSVLFDDQKRRFYDLSLSYGINRSFARNSEQAAKERELASKHFILKFMATVTAFLATTLLILGCIIFGCIAIPIGLLYVPDEVIPQKGLDKFSTQQRVLIAILTILLLPIVSFLGICYVLFGVFESKLVKEFHSRRYRKSLLFYDKSFESRKSKIIFSAFLVALSVALFVAFPPSALSQSIGVGGTLAKAFGLAEASQGMFAFIMGSLSGALTLCMGYFVNLILDCYSHEKVNNPIPRSKKRKSVPIRLIEGTDVVLERDFRNNVSSDELKRSPSRVLESRAMVYSISNTLNRNPKSISSSHFLREQDLTRGQDGQLYVSSQCYIRLQIAARSTKDKRIDRDFVNGYSVFPIADIELEPREQSLPTLDYELLKNPIPRVSLLFHSPSENQNPQLSDKRLLQSYRKA